MKRLILIIGLLLCVSAWAVMTDIGPTPAAIMDIVAGSVTLSTHDLDASDDAIGVIFLSKSTSSITHIGFNVAARTGTEPNYVVALETLADTDSPSGTKVAADANAVIATGTLSVGWNWIALTTAYTPTVGEGIAATVRYYKGTVNASNFIQTNWVHNNRSLYNGAPGAIKCTAGVWANGTQGTPMVAIKRTDGTVSAGQAVTSITTLLPWDSGTTPGLYKGTKWTPIIDTRLIGAYVYAKISDTSDFNLELYTADVSAATESIAVDASKQFGNSASFGSGFIPFTPRTLTAGTAYRIVLEPTTANDFGTAIKMTFPDAASRYWNCGLLQYTESAGLSGNDPNSWTDSATAFALVIPIYDQIDIAAATGGGQPVLGGGVVK